MTKLKRGGLCALMLAGALGTSGCQEDVNYGYFQVRIKVQEPVPTAFLERIAGCGVNVAGADADFAPLDCAAGRFSQPELGVFDWSTAATGKVNFQVNIQDVAAKPLGTGKSADYDIRPGGTVNAEVIITPDPDALMRAMMQ